MTRRVMTGLGLREGRALGMYAAPAMLDSYSTLVSGVLIGMSDGLPQGGPAPAAARSTTG